MDGAMHLPPPQTSDEPMADAPTTHPYTIDTTDENDSDWEYEYHPTETETHYIVLDISSSQPVGPHQGKPRTRNDTPPPPPPSTSPPQPQPTTPIPPVPPDPTPPPPTLPEISIKDLHTPTPHLTHNNILYHCSWSTPLGTDVLLSRHPASPSTSASPRPSSPDINIDILGLSRIKLTARPIKHLHPEQPQTQTQPLATPRNRPPTAATTAHPVVERRERQVAFLARLAEVKSAKGERDAVQLGGWKPGEDPRGRKGRKGRGGGRARGRVGGEVEEDGGAGRGEMEEDGGGGRREMEEDGGGRGGRRVRWGDEDGVGLEEARALVQQREKEARRRVVVGDEEILQGEEEGEEEVSDVVFTEGEQVRDQALVGEEEVDVDEIEGVIREADLGALDADNEDVAMGES